jgi:hypothetical protein
MDLLNRDFRLRKISFLIGKCEQEKKEQSKEIALRACHHLTIAFYCP